MLRTANVSKMRFPCTCSVMPAKDALLASNVGEDDAWVVMSAGSSNGVLVATAFDAEWVSGEAGFFLSIRVLVLFANCEFEISQMARGQVNINLDRLK